MTVHQQDNSSTTTDNKIAELEEKLAEMKLQRDTLLKRSEARMKVATVEDAKHEAFCAVGELLSTMEKAGHVPVEVKLLGNVLFAALGSVVLTKRVKRGRLNSIATCAFMYTKTLEERLDVIEDQVHS